MVLYLKYCKSTKKKEMQILRSSGNRFKRFIRTDLTKCIPKVLWETKNEEEDNSSFEMIKQTNKKMQI